MRYKRPEHIDRRTWDRLLRHEQMLAAALDHDRRVRRPVVENYRNRNERLMRERRAREEARLLEGFPQKDIREIADALGMTVPEARKHIADYRAKYPPLRKPE